MINFAPNAEGVWYDLTSEVYHKAQGISQSRLKEFDEFATPLHYLARRPKSPTEDMEFGTICHTAILEPELLPRAYHLRPETYPADGKKGETVQKPWNGNSNWCDAWLQAHADRPVIRKPAEDKISRIVARVNRLPEFSTALKYGRREVSHFKIDHHTGLLCKCRVDVLAKEQGEGETWIFDLKKVQSGCADFESFRDDALDRGYHIQAASYLRITGAQHFVFVPFDDDEPFDACQWEPDEEFLRLGLVEYRRILNAFAECVKADSWPGYAQGIHPLTLPYRGVRRLKEVSGVEL